MEHQVSLFESLVCEDASRAKLGCFSSHACQVFDLYRKGTLHCVSWSHHRSWWFALGSQFLEGMLTVDFLKVIVYLFSHGYHLGNLPRLFIFFFGAILRQKPSNKKIVQNFDPTKTTGKPMNFGAAGAWRLSSGSSSTLGQCSQSGSDIVQPRGGGGVNVMSTWLEIRELNEHLSVW